MIGYNDLELSTKGVNDTTIFVCKMIKDNIVNTTLNNKTNSDFIYSYDKDNFILQIKNMTDKDLFIDLLENTSYGFLSVFSSDIGWCSNYMVPANNEFSLFLPNMEDIENTILIYTNYPLRINNILEQSTENIEKGIITEFSDFFYGSTSITNK